MVSKGEGSRGGHVISHTKSGLPIYEGHHQTQVKSSWSQTKFDHKKTASFLEDQYINFNIKIPDATVKGVKTYNELAKSAFTLAHPEVKINEYTHIPFTDRRGRPKKGA